MFKASLGKECAFKKIVNWNHIYFLTFLGETKNFPNSVVEKVYHNIREIDSKNFVCVCVCVRAACLRVSVRGWEVQSYGYYRENGQTRRLSTRKS